MVHNGGFFVPIWIKYYSKIFDSKDIYILDHGSDDGTITKEIRKKYNVIDVPFNGLAIGDFKEQRVAKLHRKLEGKYDYIVVCDIDEIVIANLFKYKDLIDFLDNAVDEHIKVSTRSVIEVVHENEKPIDLNKGILSQRKYWFEENLYNKPIINKTTPYWTIGFHHICTTKPKKIEGGYEYNFFEDAPSNPGVILVHLRRMDYRLLMESNKTFIDKYGKDKRDMQWFRNFLLDREYYEWFYSGLSDEELYKYLEVIPENFKNYF